jgi:hypothetical protein
MTLQTVRGQCQNPGCSLRGQTQTLTLDSSKVPRCGKCAQPLVDPTKADVKKPAAPSTPYDKAKQAVRAAYGVGQMAGYIEKVLQFLDLNHKFRADFIEEMGKQVDFTKFVRNSGHVRATSERDICVDNALRAVGANLPQGCPAGEKYTFEVPCIMEACGWTYMDYSRNRPMLQAPFSTFLGRAQQETGGRVYLVVRSEHAGASESHMIVVYATAQGATQQAWIHDVQKQPNNYAEGYCEVWMSLTAAATPRKPYCTLDLRTGKIGAWQE